jgi:hypothetical protein
MRRSACSGLVAGNHHAVAQQECGLPRSADNSLLTAAMTERKPVMPPAPADPAGEAAPVAAGMTRATQSGLRQPRLPHERDESSDSQTAAPAEGGGQPGRQAYEDLQRGVVDTDRGPLLDRLYRRLFKRARRSRDGGS